MRGAVPAALLSAADSLWSDEEIEAAISICGDSVNGLLDGYDPHASAGRMDESADLLDREPGLREQYIREAGLIPRGLLSAESRVLAAMELVEQRRHPWLEWLMRNAHSVLREGERLIRIIGDPATQAAFDARCHQSRTGGWHVVPAISMALALAARHGREVTSKPPGGSFVNNGPGRTLRVVPQLVTIDLIIAELVVGRRAEEEERIEMITSIDAVSTSEEIKATYRRYLSSFLAVRDPKIDAALREAIDGTDMLDRGPYLEATPPYAPGNVTAGTHFRRRSRRPIR